MPRYDWGDSLPAYRLLIWWMEFGLACCMARMLVNKSITAFSRGRRFDDLGGARSGIVSTVLVVIVSLGPRQNSPSTLVNSKINSKAHPHWVLFFLLAPTHLTSARSTRTPKFLTSLLQKTPGPLLPHYYRKTPSPLLLHSHYN